MTIALLLPSDPTLALPARHLADAILGLRSDSHVIAFSSGRPVGATLPVDAVYLVAAEALPQAADIEAERTTVLLHDIPDDVEQLTKVQRIIVPSEAVQSRLTRVHGITANRIAVVAPGIDPLPRSIGSAAPVCQILSVGMLIARKGHADLIAALGRLLDLDWSLCIAAPDLVAPREPDNADALHTLIASLGLGERITFSATPDWQRADLFALVSEYEAYGCAVAEALRRGLPVAVTNVGAVPTLVGPEAGVICAPGEIDQLSKALRRLIFDAKLRSAMAEVAWRSGQALPSWQDQAKHVIELIA